MIPDPPRYITRSVRAQIESMDDHLNKIKYQKCKPKDAYFYNRDLSGVYSTSMQTYAPGEFRMVAAGYHVNESTWKKMLGRAKKERKYALDYKGKDKNGKTMKIVVIPDLRNGTKNKQLWACCNDGYNIKTRRNRSNCVFALIDTNGMRIPWVVNTKSIKFDDQITVDYGKDYWKCWGNR